MCAWHYWRYGVVVKWLSLRPLRGDQKQLFVVVVGGAGLSDRSCYYIGRISIYRNTDASYIYHIFKVIEKKNFFPFLSRVLSSFEQFPLITHVVIYDIQTLIKTPRLYKLTFTSFF